MNREKYYYTGYEQPDGLSDEESDEIQRFLIHFSY